MSNNETLNVSPTRRSASPQLSGPRTQKSEENNYNTDYTSDEEDEINAEQGAFESDKSVDKPVLRRSITSDRSESPKPIKQSISKFDKSNEIKKTEKSSKCSIKSTRKNETATKSPLRYFIVVSIIVVIGCSYYFGTSTFTTLEDTNDDPIEKRIADLQKNFRNIKQRFPGIKPRSLREMESGIVEIIRESEKPCTIVLFSNRTNEISCLAKMIGNASSEALHSDGSLELHPTDFGENYGLAIDRWKPHIIAKKAVIVHDLLNINPRAIQAFHTMCDRENPLVEGAVYILTIVTTAVATGSETASKFIEDQLTNRFINKVPDEKLQPLITRITDGPIISVQPEITPTRCPL